MLTNRQKQQMEEIEIFKNFVRVVVREERDYSNCDVNSVEKRLEPEPDLLCSFGDRIIAIEVTTLRHQKGEGELSDREKFQKLCYEELGKLTPDEQERFRKNFDNSHITIKPICGTSLMRKIMPSVFNYLLSLGKTAKGRYDNFPSDLKNKVNRIVIHRLKSFTDGPLFDRWPRVLDFGVECFNEKIKNKLHSNYKSQYPIELLICDMFGLREFEYNRVKEFIESNFLETNFRKIWMYSWKEDNIKFVIKR